MGFVFTTFLGRERAPLITPTLYHSNLSLNSNKAQKFLKWKNILTAKEAIKFTLAWYKLFFDKKSSKEIIQFSFKQIKEYQKLLKSRKV